MNFMSDYAQVNPMQTNNNMSRAINNASSVPVPAQTQPINNNYAALLAGVLSGLTGRR